MIGRDHLAPSGYETAQTAGLEARNAILRDGALQRITGEVRRPRGLIDAQHDQHGREQIDAAHHARVLSGRKAASEQQQRHAHRGLEERGAVPELRMLSEFFTMIRRQHHQVFRIHQAVPTQVFEQIPQAFVELPALLPVRLFDPGQPPRQLRILRRIDTVLQAPGKLEQLLEQGRHARPRRFHDRVLHVRKEGAREVRARLVRHVRIDVVDEEVDRLRARAVSQSLVEHRANARRGHLRGHVVLIGRSRAVGERLQAHHQALPTDGAHHARVRHPAKCVVMTGWIHDQAIVPDFEALRESEDGIETRVADHAERAVAELAQVLGQRGVLGRKPDVPFRKRSALSRVHAGEHGGVAGWCAVRSGVGNGEGASVSERCSREWHQILIHPRAEQAAVTQSIKHDEGDVGFLRRPSFTSGFILRAQQQVLRARVLPSEKSGDASPRQKHQGGEAPRPHGHARQRAAEHRDHHGEARERTDRRPERMEGKASA